MSKNSSEKGVLFYQITEHYISIECKIQKQYNRTRNVNTTHLREDEYPVTILLQDSEHFTQEIKLSTSLD